MKNEIFIGILLGCIIVLIAALANSPHKAKENVVLYDRFKIQKVIHSRLVIAEDLETNQLYWMSRDHEWLVTSPYFNKKD